MAHALVVEDDTDSARMMATLVGSTGYTTSTAGSLRDARRLLAMQQPDVVLLDLHLPDGNGMALLDEGALPPRTEVVFITGYASRNLDPGAAQGRGRLPGEAGGPEAPAGGAGPLPGGRASRGAGAARAGGASAAAGGAACGDMVGSSPPMRAVFDAIRRVARSSVPVFITGESGTGKELAAHAVHALGPRSQRPFLAINAGALSPQLVESELFGHERGSFTGADRQHAGYFERAHGGTLFLDEITEMPLELQVKLLRVLESGTYTRVGATEPRRADVRIVAACNRDPAQAVAEGRLREDLYWRLHVFPIHLPPLRERGGDVAQIARHLLARIAPGRSLSPAALQALAGHRWPGNVRELRNVLQRASVLADGDVIDAAQLAAGLPAVALQPVPVLAAPDITAEPSVAVPVGTPLADVERAMVLATFAHHGQRREATAAALGISLKTLYNRLRAYGVG